MNKNKIKHSKRGLSMKIKLKYIIPMLMIIMTACTSSSCSKKTLQESSAVNNESTDSSSTAQVGGNFPEKINMEIERVKFDADVLAHSSRKYEG